MTLVDQNLFPKIILQEAANDGSDFSNPAADYRVMFVGEDGLFHLKDSAGTVTTPAQGALSNPMTTKGDVILADTGGTPTRLAAGTSAYVLTSNGAAAFPSWQAASGGAGAVLGAKTYSTGSDTAWASTSSTTVADIDATNAAITVTIPASGAVVVAVDLDWTYTVANSGGFFVLRTGSTDLQALGAISGAVGSGGIGGGSVSSGHFSGHFYATGLTPGSLTLKVGFRRLGSTTLNVYANDGSGAAGHLAGPFNMVVWAA